MAPKHTAKQRAFVLEYPKDFNGTKAAIRAGYSEKGANVAAIRALSNATILEAIEKEYTKRAMSLDEALVRVTRIATGEDEEAKIKDREWGLEILMKNHGALAQRMEHSGIIEHQHRLSDSEVVQEFAALIAEAEAGPTSGTGS